MTNGSLYSAQIALEMAAPTSDDAAAAVLTTQDPTCDIALAGLNVYARALTSPTRVVVEPIGAAARTIVTGAIEPPTAPAGKLIDTSVALPANASTLLVPANPLRICLKIQCGGTAVVGVDLKGGMITSLANAPKRHLTAPHMLYTASYAPLRAVTAYTGTALCLALLAALARPDVPATAPDMLGYARKTDLPAAASANPPATALDGARGSAVVFARADYTHAVQVQRTVLVMAANGTATWVFARPIPVPAGKLPPVAYMVEDSGTPVVVQVTACVFASSGGTDTHTAVTIRAQRSRALPATLASLMALVNLNVFGIAASGVLVNLFAADPTQ